MKKSISIVFLLLFCFAFCRAQVKKQIAGSYSLPTECMGTELDGSQTLKAWGTGNNKADAVEQAEKNAVNDVLFKGISNGKQECNIKPVIFEVNARERHEDYFNKFFADSGPYKNFISLKDEPRFPLKKKDRKVGTKEVEFGVVVRVLRAELKKKMIADGILKQ